MPDVYPPQAAQMSVKAAQEILADLITDLNARTQVQLWLYQTNIAPNPTNTLANFTEANFGGYARQTIASWSAVGVDSSNNAFATAAITNYACNGTGTPNQIYGSILVGTPSGAVNATGSGVGGNAGSYGSVSVTNPGAGYTAAPAVTVTGATGTGAVITSVINASGQVTAFNVITPGSGYTTYTVTVDTPKELIKQNVLSASGISMAVSTDVLPTFCQLIQPSQPL